MAQIESESAATSRFSNNIGSETEKNHEHQPKECAFCGVLEGKVEAGIVMESDVSMVIVSLEGHPIVIPKRHVVDPTELTQEEVSDIFGKATQLSSIVQEAYGASGTNIVMNIGYSAGQRVDHLHTHVMPRTEGDKKVRFLYQEPLPLETRIERASQLTSLLQQKQEFVER